MYLEGDGQLPCVAPPPPAAAPIAPAGAAPPAEAAAAPPQAAAAAAPPPPPTAAAAPAAAADAAAGPGIAGIANLPSIFSEFVMIWETKSVGVVGYEHLAREEAIA
jgi:hypothetical protein